MKYLNIYSSGFKEVNIKGIDIDDLLSVINRIQAILPGYKQEHISYILYRSINVIVMEKEGC